MKRFRFFAEIFVALDVAITAVIANKFSRSTLERGIPKMSQILARKSDTFPLKRVFFLESLCSEPQKKQPELLEVLIFVGVSPLARPPSIRLSQARPPGRVYLIRVAFWRENSNNLESDLTSVDF